MRNPEFGLKAMLWVWGFDGRMFDEMVWLADSQQDELYWRGSGNAKIFVKLLLSQSFCYHGAFIIWSKNTWPLLVQCSENELSVNSYLFVGPRSSRHGTFPKVCCCHYCYFISASLFYLLQWLQVGSVWLCSISVFGMMKISLLSPLSIFSCQG